MTAKKTAKKLASKKQLAIWLAKALCFVPPNLCDINPFRLPPLWVIDAISECKKYGITFKPPKKKSPKKK